jgi:serine/threonine protein kinase
MTPAPRSIAGRYRLIRPLGQGGMGRVWLARDEMLRRDVAIKELVPSAGLSIEHQREMRERSIREARAIARLNHTNVVRIFDVLHAGGEPWIVMEFVPSRSLQQVLAENGPLTPAEAARIGLAVLAALRAAHRAGLLHRDVKPANVLLADDGRVVLTDFGLATAPEDPSMTQTGVVLGSPSYLAPERAVDGVVGPAADLWSLGATLYSAVEGRPPYARPSMLATLAALATEPPTPAARAGAMAPVLEGLLRKDPSRRVGAEEAERLLRQAAAQQPSSSATAAPATVEVLLPQSPEPEPLNPTQPVAAPPTGAESRARGGRRLVLVAGVVAVALLAGGLTAYQLGTRSGSGEPVRGNDTRVAPLPMSAASEAEPSPSVPPSPSPTASPTRRSTAPAAGTTNAVPPPAPKSPDLSGPLDGTGPIIGISGQCLDNHSGRISDGNPIVSWDCNQQPNQVWTVVNGRYTVQGKCLTVRGGSTVSGTSVVLWTCDGSPGQQWRASAADNSIRNPASGLCLTTFDRYTAAVISTCVVGPGQKWTRG